MIRNRLTAGQIVWRVNEGYVEQVLVINPHGPIVRFIEEPLNKQENVKCDINSLYEKFEDAFRSLPEIDWSKPRFQFTVKKYNCDDENIFMVKTSVPKFIGFLEVLTEGDFYRGDYYHLTSDELKLFVDYVSHQQD